MNEVSKIPPRVAAIHDLSCLGRCALTVILPTLSVMGYQAVPIPTALLSTHTGGFTDLHFRDLTADMERITAHFGALGTTFRAIYSGFLGSAEQIDSVTHLIERFGELPDESGEKPLILIDPVMGEDGELYSTYTHELMLGMRRLARHAQLLTPNLTEACFLTDTPYRVTADMREDEAIEFAKTLLGRLSGLTDARTVITGIHLQTGGVANVGRDADGSVFVVRRPQEKISYPGTGDLFASVLLGATLRGERLVEACEEAADFVAEVIRASADNGVPTRYGVALESELWRLARIPEQQKKQKGRR